MATSSRNELMMMDRSKPSEDMLYAPSCLDSSALTRQGAPTAASRALLALWKIRVAWLVRRISIAVLGIPILILTLVSLAIAELAVSWAWLAIPCLGKA